MYGLVFDYLNPPIGVGIQATTITVSTCDIVWNEQFFFLSLALADSGTNRLKSFCIKVPLNIAQFLLLFLCKPIDCQNNANPRL